MVVIPIRKVFINKMIRHLSTIFQEPAGANKISLYSCFLLLERDYTDPEKR